MDGIAVKPLTTDFHEGGFLSKLNQENGLGFWFQLNDDQKQQAGSPWGPANVQALNRYSYVQNNPIKLTDPSGHAIGPFCGMCDLKIDISNWNNAAVLAAQAVCLFAGCNVDTEKGLITGPTPQEWADDQVASLGTPIGMAGGFSHAWIERGLFRQLKTLVGEADFNKFAAALKKGVVPPQGRSGIKILESAIGRYTHELKIGGSAQRLLGYINEKGVLIFDKFIRGGLH